MENPPAIKRGDLIIKCKPFAFVVFSNMREEICNYCFQKDPDLKQCKQCLFAYYCDQKCQKSDWKDHKVECANLKRIYPTQPEDCVRLMARIISKLKRKPDEVEKFGSATCGFQDLPSHSEDIKQNSCHLFQDILDKLKNFLPTEDCPATDKLLEIYGKVAFNSFDITLWPCSKLGAGLYLWPNKIKHSCKPNAARVFYGAKMHIVAMNDISELNPSNVFISYVNLLATTEERQRTLKAKHYFNCECERCLDPENVLIERSIKCPNINCEHPVLIKEKSFVCLGCGEVKFGKNKRKQVEILTKRCKRSLKEMVNLRQLGRHDEMCEIAKQCIDESKSTFHLLNLIHSDLLLCAIAAANALQRKDLAIQYSKEQLVSVRYYFGNSHLLTSWYLSSIGRSLLDSITEDSDINEIHLQAEPFFREALDVIAVTHNPNHPVYVSCKSYIDQCEMIKDLEKF